MKGKGALKAATVTKRKEGERSGETIDRSLQERKPAVQTKAKEGNEVSAFLSSIGLAVYAPLFLREGIEDLETLHELTDAHLSSLGLPIGHRLKLLKRLKDLHSSNSSVQIPVPEAPLPVAAEPVVVPAAESVKNKQGGRGEGEKVQSTYDMYRVAIEEFRRTGIEEKESRWGKGKEAKPSPPSFKPLPKSPPLDSPAKFIEPKRLPVPEVCAYCLQSFPKAQAQVRHGKPYCSIVCLEKASKSEAIIVYETKSAAVNEETNEENASNSSRDSKEEDIETITAQNTEEISAESLQVSQPEQTLPSPQSPSQLNPSRVPTRLKKKPAVPAKLPSPRHSLLESSEQVRGWDAPVEASFDLGRNEE